MVLRTLSLALRNVGRNRRRTLLSLSAIVFGIVATLLLQGMLNGLVGMITRMLVEGRVGAVLVQRAGFDAAEENPLRLDLPQSAELETKLLGVPGVVAVTGRIRFDGSIGTGTQAAISQLVAIDPARELDVCPLRWQTSGIRGLGAGDTRGIVLGRALADGLDVRPGATLMVQGATRAGPANVLDADFVEILGATDPIVSKRIAIVPLAWAQELLGMKGRVTEYALRVQDLSDAPAVAARVKQALGPGYDVTPWGDVLAQIRDLIGMLRAVLGVVIAVLMLVVLTGIANTMLMSVYERVREVGTLLALGVRRRTIVQLFLAESALIGLFGGALGAAVGGGLVWRLHATGVEIRPPGAEFAQLITPHVPPSFVALSVALAVVGAVIAALYPAWRASRLVPVDALRSN